MLKGIASSISYERARSALAVVMTGETAKYANLLLKKGVAPVR